MGVKIYGSPDFTPNDLPAGTTLERAPFSTPSNLIGGQELWAGCLGSGCQPMDDIGYSHADWRTATAWSYGGYGTTQMDAYEQGNDCNTPYGGGCLPGSLQDSQNFTGWNSFLNQNAGNKRLVVRAGTDLPAGSTITYVRVWIRGGSFSAFGYPQPYWQGAPDQSGSNDFPPLSSAKLWDPGAWFVSPSTYNIAQVSSKWTTSPVPGQPWTPALMNSLAWGVRHGRRGEEGNPGSGVINVGEMAIEVGYTTTAQYAVTTGPVTDLTGTTATLTGTVNPFGDPTGFWFFQYGTNTALGTSSPQVAQPSSTTYNISLNLAGLVSDTTYYYRAAARDSSGVFHYGATLSFLTVTSCSTRASLVGG